MRWLAEFIMRGRAQAAGLAILGGLVLLPIVSQATLALVTLRKGLVEGTIIALCAFLPGMIFILSGADSKAGKLLIALMILTYASALLLRSSVSLLLTTVGLAGLSSLVALILVAADPGIVTELDAVLSAILENIQREQTQVPKEISAMLSGYTALKSAGFIALSSTWGTLIGLFVARWLQAMLYNPGGFQEEFHQCRINLPVLLASVGTAIFFELKGFEFMHWVNLCLTPIVLAGLSLIHFMVKKLKLGYAGLGIFYASIIFFPSLAMLITMFLGVTDPVVNYRMRFNLKQ